MVPTPDLPDEGLEHRPSTSVFTTLKRLRELGPVPHAPQDLEGLTGLPAQRLSADAPWLRTFTHSGRRVVYTESVLAAPAAHGRFVAHLRRSLANAIRNGHGRWPELRDVFSTAVVELVEALVPQTRDTNRDLADRIAECHLRQSIGLSIEVDDGPRCVAAVLLLHDALSSPDTSSRVLTRLALLPVGGDHRAMALDGLRLADLVTDENREQLSRLLRVSSGRLRIAAARALRGPRAEASLAHALTERRNKPDIPVRAAAALLEVAPQHPLVPDALALLELGLEVPDVSRLAHEALRSWGARERGDKLRG